MSLKSHSQMSLTNIKLCQFNTSGLFDYYYESYPNSAKCQPQFGQNVILKSYRQSLFRAKAAGRAGAGLLLAEVPPEDLAELAGPHRQRWRTLGCRAATAVDARERNRLGNPFLLPG